MSRRALAVFLAVVVLVLLLPAWPYATHWGWAPFGGGAGLLVLLLLVLWFVGAI